MLVEGLKTQEDLDIFKKENSLFLLFFSEDA